MPRGANLELKGEPGTKMEELFVQGDPAGYDAETRRGMLNNMVVGFVLSFRILATSYARAEVLRSPLQ